MKFFMRSSGNRPSARGHNSRIPDAYWSLTATQLLAALDSSADGLRQAEADARLALYGPNTLNIQRNATALGLFLKQFKSPLVLLLVFAAAVSAFVGECTDAVNVLRVVGCIALL